MEGRGAQSAKKIVSNRCADRNKETKTDKEIETGIFRRLEMKKNLKELEKKKKNEQRCNAEGEGMHKTKAQREKEIGTKTETQSIHADRCAKSGKSRTQGNKL